MYVNRYVSDSLVNGKLLSSNSAIYRIREGVRSGEIETFNIVINEGDRLDVLAGRYYGDGRLWWVIAAASNIGWWLQVPPGTQLAIPRNIGDVLRFV